MSRAEGERTRLRHEIKRARALLDAFESTVEDRGDIPCTENARAVADAGLRLVTHAAHLLEERGS